MLLKHPVLTWTKQCRSMWVVCGCCERNCNLETSDWVLIYHEMSKNYFPPRVLRMYDCTFASLQMLLCNQRGGHFKFVASFHTKYPRTWGGKKGQGGEGGGHCTRHKVFWYRCSAWTNVVHLRNPNRRRLNLERNNSRISQVYAARAPSRLAALIHNIHHRGNWWAKSRPNDFLRRQSGGTGIFFMTPRDLFMPRSRQITAYPYMRPRGCSQSTAALAARQERSCAVCEMGLQTRRHLSSTQETACRQQKHPPPSERKNDKNQTTKKKNKTKKKRCRAINEGHRCKTTCLTVIMFAPGRNIASFSLSLPYLYEGGKQFISSLQITQRGDDETSEGIWCAISKKTWDPLNFMNKWMN